jgi:hypothetical protein
MLKLATAICLASLLLSGCLSISVGTKEDSSSLEMKGLANGYASLNGIRPYDGTFLELGVLKRSRRSHEFEVAYVDLWPFLGVGVGLAGARMQLLFLDIGVGVLAYDPQPPDWGSDKKQEEGEGEDSQEDGANDEAKDADGSEVPETEDTEVSP